MENEAVAAVYDITISLKSPVTGRELAGTYRGDRAGASWWLKMQAYWLDTYRILPPAPDHRDEWATPPSTAFRRTDQEQT